MKNKNCVYCKKNVLYTTANTTDFKCGHVCHSYCLSKYIDNNLRCEFCRKNIEIYIFAEPLYKKLEKYYIFFYNKWRIFKESLFFLKNIIVRRFFLLYIMSDILLFSPLPVLNVDLTSNIFICYRIITLFTLLTIKFS